MRTTARRRLPLNALRVFEVAGRHESFTAAARELGVSQVAISRQVRQLEDDIGKRLFVRVHRGVVLTEAGRSLVQRLTHAIGEIEQAVAAARHERLRILRVSVEPAFAACWLASRVESFLKQYVDVDLQIESSVAIRKVGVDVDLAVRYLEGRQRRPQKSVQHLIDVIGFPVISPSLLKKRGPVILPGQLLSLPLLHEDDGSYWRQWFAAAGLGEVKLRRQLQMDDQAVLLRAAVNGQGVAIANELIAADEIAGGRLIKLFSIEVPYGAYWIVHSPSGRRTSTERRFDTWLRQALSDFQPRL